jgi:hypothetical protein
VPSLALAQDTVSETSDSLDDERINIAECDATIRSSFVFNWTFSTSPATTSVELRISDTANCPVDTESGTETTVVLQTISGPTGTSTSRSASDLVRQLAFACDAGTSRSLHVCAVGTNGTTPTTQSAIVPVDTALPTKPTVLSLAVGEGALDVRWQLESNAVRYRVEATEQGTTNVSRSPEVTGDSRRISGLRNGVPYEVRVVGISEAGNESTPSEPLVGTPQLVNDFWEGYRSAGGSEQGGCGTGGAGALALLGLVPLALRRSRS